jgi:hypothetical protein
VFYDPQDFAETDPSLYQQPPCIAVPAATDPSQYQLACGIGELLDVVIDSVNEGIARRMLDRFEEEDAAAALPLKVAEEEVVDCPRERKRRKTLPIREIGIDHNTTGLADSLGWVGWRRPTGSRSVASVSIRELTTIALARALGDGCEETVAELVDAASEEFLSANLDSLPHLGISIKLLVQVADLGV